MFLLYVAQHEHDNCEDVDIFVRLLSALGVSCVCDFTAPNPFQIPNWPQWVASKMKECCTTHGHVLVVCSEALCRCLHNSGEVPTVNMKLGMFNAVIVSNLLSQESILQRAIPVFLGACRKPEWVPLCLQGKTSICVDLFTVQSQLKGDLSLENVQRVASQCKPLVALVTGLIGHSTEVKKTAGGTDNDSVSDQQLRTLAHKLEREWPILASKLNISDSRQQVITSEYSSPIEQAYQMLLSWREDKEASKEDGGHSGLKSELLRCLEQSNWESAKTCLM